MSMVFTLRLFFKWTLLVSLSAVASFIAALLSGHNSASHIAAMLAGIATFIGIYMLIEAWAASKNMHRFLKSLKMGVIIKIALELIPAIEIFTGMVVVAAIEQLQIHNVFSATYLKTMATGTILSGVVFVIAAVYGYVFNRAAKPATHMDKAVP
jgi:hypothetical protein